MINENKQHSIKLGQWLVIKDENLLRTDNEQVVVLPKVMAALEYFIDHPNQVITFDQLNNAIWPNEVVGDNSIYNLIGQLRKTLGDNASKPVYIETISKKGYRLIAQVTITEDDAITDSANSAATQSPTEDAINTQSQSTQTSPNKTSGKLPFTRRYKNVALLLVTTGLVLLVSLFYLSEDSPALKNADVQTHSPLAKQFLTMAKFHQFKGGEKDKLTAIDYYQKFAVLSPNSVTPHIEMAYLNIDLMALIPDQKNLFYRKALLAKDNAKNKAKEKALQPSAQSANVQALAETKFLETYLSQLNKLVKKSTIVELAFTELTSNTSKVSTSTKAAFANYLFHKGNVDAAIVMQKRVIKDCATCAEGHLNLANSYMVNMALEQAAHHFNRYHELKHYDYNNPISLVSQGALSMQTLKTMHRWVQNSATGPSSKAQLNHLTLLMLNLGLFEKAQHMVTKRNLSEATDFFTLYTLNAVAGANQDFSQSLKYLKKRHELFPQNTRFALSLALAYWMSGDNETSLALLESKVIGSNLAPSNYQFLHAALLKADNQPDKAQLILNNVLDNVLKINEPNASDYMTLAMANALLGNKPNALQALDNSLKAGWVSDFNLDWWRLEDNPFLSSIKNEIEFKRLTKGYYEQLASITSLTTIK